MATLNEQARAQAEQDSTIETGVEVSQAIDETLIDSQREQEMLTMNHHVTTQSENLEYSMATSQKEKAISSVSQKTKADSETLANTINKTNKAETNNTLSEQQQLMLDIDALLGKYEELAKGISSTEGSGKTKRDLKHRLNENIKNLKRMQKDLKKHDYSNLETYKNRVLELTYYFEHYEQVRQIVVLGGRTSDIHAIIDSKQDAKYAKRQENKDARYQSSMDDVLHNAALTSLWNNDMERYEEYLEAVLNGQVEPSTHPFYTRHMQSFALVKSTSPDLYGVLVPNRRGQIKYDVYCQQNGIPCSNGYDSNRRFRTGNVGEDVINLIQGVRGKEVTPQQREAWRKAGDLGALAGCIVLGVRMIRAIFPGRDPSTGKRYRTNRGRVLGLGAGIYGIRHYKELKNMALDALNLDPDSCVARKRAERTEQQAQTNMGLSQSEAQELVNAKITYPTLVATTIGAIPIKQLIEQKIVEEKNGKLVLNKTNYATYVETMALALGRSDKDKQEMLDKVATDEAVESISNGLTNCGIKTLSDLNNLKGSSDTSTLMNSATFKTKYKTQIDALTRQTGIFSNMAKQGFIPVGLDETITILDNYDNNKNTNEQILERLKSGLLKTSPDKSYNVADMLSSPYVDLMDLQKMTMKGFTTGINEVTFSSYGELFETVYLTEWIKHNYAGRPDARSTNPFHINVRGQLEFDNTERYELHKNEIAVVGLREFKSIPTVRRNKQFYVDYLNKRRLSQI